MMKNLLRIFPLLLVTACNTPPAAEASFDVIPRVNRSTPSEGEGFILRKNTKIVYPAGNPSLARTAEQLAEHLRFTTGLTLKTAVGKDCRNAIVLDTTLNEPDPEAYRLTVTPTHILINGASGAGTFYGMQTLRKAVPTGTEGMRIAFPAVEIADAPRFPYRGMMLDVARHFFPVEFVKRYIDLLALHNFNTFHWHLSDQGWRIEIVRYPELTRKGSVREQTLVGPCHKEPYTSDGTPHGGYYTREQIEEVVRYAAECFITVVPEIELPGHMLGEVVFLYDRTVFEVVQTGIADHREKQRRDRDQGEQRALLPQADEAILNQIARQVVVPRKAGGIASQTRIKALEQLSESAFIAVLQGFEKLAVVAEFHVRERPGPAFGRFRPGNKYKPACRIFQTFFDN